jgi:superfamily II RNA helicase
LFVFKAILRNHRSNSRCPACKESLGEYQLENYSYLLPSHFISRLLASFTDVNQCETCKDFTTVKQCSQCAKDQCDLCYNKHEETHNQPEKQSHRNSDNLSPEEIEILELIKNSLTVKEFEDFLQTAKSHLNYTVLNENRKVTSIDNYNTEMKPIVVEGEIYDWSKHEKFTADDIINSKPERVKQLLRLNFTPRPYQIRMVRAGLRKDNSLVCLQTGAGKTFVRIFISY